MPQEKYSSRVRVIRALRWEPIDRFPIDLGSHFSTGISAFAYWHLREYLGLPTDEIWLPDMVQVLAYVDEDIRRRFHIDCVLLHPSWPRTRRWSPRPPYEFTIAGGAQPVQTAEGDWVIEQQAGNQVRRMRMPDGGYFFDGDWLSNWHECDEDALIRRMAAQAERIYKESDYAVIYMGGFSAFHGKFDFLCRMYENPAEVLEINSHRLEHALAKAAKVLAAMGEYIQLIEICDDMGIQTGPMCRPSMFAEFVAPFLARFCSFIHNNSDCKVFLHCCGSIKPLIPILIECGVDALNPVQISAADMDPAELKAEFGDRIVFWGGGCNTQQVLGTGTPEEVAENVRHLVRIFKPGGGFVFNQVHNILGNVPPENVVAMLDTAYAESWYQEDPPEQGA
jgi:uroporphyrinogen decarboxylase